MCLSALCTTAAIRASWRSVPKCSCFTSARETSCPVLALQKCAPSGHQPCAAAAGQDIRGCFWVHLYLLAIPMLIRCLTDRLACRTTPAKSAQLKALSSSCSLEKRELGWRPHFVMLLAETAGAADGPVCIWWRSRTDLVFGPLFLRMKLSLTPQRFDVRALLCSFPFCNDQSTRA